MLIVSKLCGKKSKGKKRGSIAPKTHHKLTKSKCHAAHATPWCSTPRRARRWEPYQMAWCEKNKGAKGTDEYMTCLGRFNRDNNTWKKLDVILKHLLNNDAE